MNRRPQPLDPQILLAEPDWLGGLAAGLLWDPEEGSRLSGSRRSSGVDPEAADPEAVERELAVAVAELREPYRTALLLRFFHDLGTGQIADELGVPVETVGVRIQRALDLLRGNLEARWGSGPWAQTLASRFPPAPDLEKAMARGQRGSRRIIVSVVLAVVFLWGAGGWLWDRFGGVGDVPGPEPVARRQATPGAVDVTAPAPAPRWGGVRGRVVESRSLSALPGIALSLVDREGRQLASTESGENGAFQFDGVPVGEHQLRWAPPLGFLPPSHRNVVWVSVRAGEGGVSSDLRLEVGAIVSGRVFSEEGDPAVAEVVLVHGTLTQRARTENLGQFSFAIRPGVAVSLYAATATGVTPVVGPVDLTADGVGGLELHLGPAASVSGQVVDENGAPILGLELALRGPLPGASFQAWTRTDDDGRFAFEGAPPGLFVIRRRPVQGREEPVPEDAFELAPGGTRTDMNLSFEQPFDIAGRVVRLADRRGLGGVSVTLSCDGAIIRHAVTDDDGHYAFARVREGEHEIVVGRHSRKGILRGQGEVNFAVERETQEIRVHVLDADLGSPVTRFHAVALERAPAENPALERPGLTLEDVVSPQVAREVRFLRKDQPPVSNPEGLYGCYRALDRELVVVILAPGYEDLVQVVAAGEDRTPLELMLEAEPVPLWGGSVEDGEGRPIVGATVYLEALAVASPVATSLADGTFDLAAIPRHVRRIVVCHPDHAPAVLDLVGERRRDVRVQLRPGSSVEGVLEREGRPVQSEVRLRVEGIGELTVSTDAQGRFSWRVPPGRHEFRVEVGPAPDEFGGPWRVERIVEVGREERREIRVAIPRIGVTLELEGLGKAAEVTVTGAVETAGGDLIPVAEVRLHPADGRVVISGLPEGRARLVGVLVDPELDDFEGPTLPRVVTLDVKLAIGAPVVAVPQVETVDPEGVQPLDGR